MELFDLYDAERRLTGEVIARGEKLPEGRYHVSVHICIFGDDGRMLIQKRVPFKDSYPGLWDVSVGGSVVAGETSRQAAIREVREELGLDILPDARPAVTTSFADGFDDVYTLTVNVAPADLRLQPEEVSEVRWASYDEIISMINGGSFVPHRIPLIDLLFTYRKGIGKRCPIK